MKQYCEWHLDNSQAPKSPILNQQILIDILIIEKRSFFVSTICLADDIVVTVCLL